MTANINETVQNIKRVGVSNCRITPMAGASPLDGLQQIEICENGGWRIAVTGITRKMAEDIVAQASNRVILG